MNRQSMVLALVFLFMFGTWTMEIGEGCVRFDCTPTKGWLRFDAWQTYHFGLYMQIATLMLLAFAYAKKEDTGTA